jgi:hypothetical protein
MGVEVLGFPGEALGLFIELGEGKWGSSPPATAEMWRWQWYCKRARIEMLLDRLGRERSWARFWEVWRRPGRPYPSRWGARGAPVCCRRWRRRRSRFSSRTIFKAGETVSGFGLGRVWAVLACSAGAVLGCDVVVMGCCDAEVQVSFPPLLISNFCFAFCFLVWIYYLISNLNSILFCRS